MNAPVAASVQQDINLMLKRGTCGLNYNLCRVVSFEVNQCQNNYSANQSKREKREGNDWLRNWREIFFTNHVRDHSLNSQSNPFVVVVGEGGGGGEVKPCCCCWGWVNLFVVVVEGGGGKSFCCCLGGGGLNPFVVLAASSFTKPG